MRNIHVLSTDKPSRLCKNNNEFYYVIDGIFNLGKEKYNIYITSDEEIDEKTKPCWCVNTIKNTWDKDLIYYQGAMPQYHFVGFKKIILTTDQDLIKDGVQPIPDEFLEWFVKNPSCEEVEVITEQYTQNYHKDIWHNRYKIIIPKEESKQERERGVIITHVGKQETLEEAAKRYVEQITAIEFGKPHNAPHRVKTFIAGAKWQQEQDRKKFSEEEVLNLLNLRTHDLELAYNKISICYLKTKEWFEQFKKK